MFFHVQFQDLLVKITVELYSFKNLIKIKVNQKSSNQTGVQKYMKSSFQND